MTVWLDDKNFLSTEVYSQNLCNTQHRVWNSQAVRLLHCLCWLVVHWVFCGTFFGMVLRHRNHAGLKFGCPPSANFETPQPCGMFTSSSKVFEQETAEYERHSISVYLGHYSEFTRRWGQEEQCERWQVWMLSVWGLGPVTNDGWWGNEFGIPLDDRPLTARLRVGTSLPTPKINSLSAPKIDSLSTPLYWHRQHDNINNKNKINSSLQIDNTKTLTTTTTSSTFTSTSTPTGTSTSTTTTPTATTATTCIGTWALLTHPTPRVTDHERAVPVSAQQKERWWGCCACVCIGTWTLSSHPTPPPPPPHPTGNWSWKSCACLCSTGRKMMRLLCLCVHRNMNVIIPPHPTQRVQSPWRVYQCWSFRLYGTLMVPPQPKELNPLEGFLSVDHLPCNVCLWWGSRSDASVPMGKWKIDSPSTPKSAFCVGSELIFGVGSEFLVLGVSRCWEWVDFRCWKWVVNHD